MSILLSPSQPHRLTRPPHRICKYSYHHNLSEVCDKTEKMSQPQYTVHAGELLTKEFPFDYCNRCTSTNCTLPLASVFTLGHSFAMSTTCILNIALIHHTLVSMYSYIRLQFSTKNNTWHLSNEAGYPSSWADLKVDWWVSAEPSSYMIEQMSVYNNIIDISTKNNWYDPHKLVVQRVHYKQKYNKVIDFETKI